MIWGRPDESEKSNDKETHVCEWTEGHLRQNKKGREKENRKYYKCGKEHKGQSVKKRRKIHPQYKNQYYRMCRMRFNLWEWDPDERERTRNWEETWNDEMRRWKASTWGNGKRTKTTEEPRENLQDRIKKQKAIEAAFEILATTGKTKRKWRVADWK